ncbi:MAG: thioredoxin family protein [Ignavibacteriales bacterium]|nr:thioredoxin family protein [Ignavibacteriales bacterium]
MARQILIIFTAAVLISSILHADEPKKTVGDFTLEDCKGEKHSLVDYSSSKAVVLMFVATQCPISNSYNGRMVELYKDYASKGVSFIAINSNKQENVEEVRNHSKEHGFEFVVLKDWNNVIADKLEASVTPEIYVLNSKREVLYHGRIDDSSRENRVTSKDLRTALDRILAGKTVEVTETKAFGCSIKRIK